MKYQPKGRPRGSSSDDGNGTSNCTFRLNIHHVLIGVCPSIYIRIKTVAFKQLNRCFEFIFCFRSNFQFFSWCPLWLFWFVSSRCAERTIIGVDLEMGWWIDASRPYPSRRIGTYFSLHVPGRSRKTWSDWNAGTGPITVATRTVENHVVKLISEISFFTGSIQRFVMIWKSMLPMRVVYKWRQPRLRKGC